MSVSLGGLSLSEDLILEIGPAPAGHSARRLIGGAMVVQADGSSGGRTLTLAGEHHWTLAQVDQIRDMESLGLPQTLVHHRGTFAVLIVDTSDLTPSIFFADPTAADWFSGGITLIEV